MDTRRTLCAIAFGLSMIGACHAERAPAAAPARIATSVVEPAIQRLRIPGTVYEVTVGKSPASQRGVPPPPAMMQAIVTWIADNFDLPRNPPLPVVKLASARKITTFRYTGELSDHPLDVAAVPKGQREVVAAYDPLAKAIYLHENWTGQSAAELSALVHEMVHHLQYFSSVRHECEQARERLAYAAQDRWLQLFGRDLATEFELDKFTLAVTTQCFF
jgi:hypothetical protein